MADRRAIDWEAIEREYRAGQLSVAEIGRQHGVSHTAINKRAKLKGWTRNLAQAVKAEAENRLVSDEVSTGNARETVEAAAARVVELVRQHRRGLAGDNARISRLAEKLGTLMDGVETLKDLETAQGIAESIARTRSKLIPLERQAFGLNDKADPAAIVNVNASASASASVDLSKLSDDDLDALDTILSHAAANPGPDPGGAP